jgi:RNA polymerase sigma-70 factor (ECF subfamily)
MGKSPDSTVTQASSADFDTKEASLRALLSGIIGQDESALGALYDATVSRVYALALRITGHPEAAEEVISDVYLQIWQQAHNFDPQRGPVMAWIYTLCRSRALDNLRRRDNAETHPEPENLNPAAGSATDDPLHILLGMEHSSAVFQALSALGPTERQLLAMWLYRDLSHQQIAANMGIPLGTVKTTLRKTIEKLKQIFYAGSTLQEQNHADG